MKAHKQTKLTVQLTVDGEEKLQTQTFANIKPAADEASILALGEVMTQFHPADSQFDSVIETVQFEYSK